MASILPKGTSAAGLRGPARLLLQPPHSNLHPPVPEAASRCTRAPPGTAPQPISPRFPARAALQRGGQRGNLSQFIFHRYVFLPALSPSSWITAVITLHLRRGALCQDPDKGKNQSQNSFLSASTWQSPALGLVTKSLEKKKLFLSNHHPKSKAAATANLTKFLLLLSHPRAPPDPAEDLGPILRAIIRPCHNNKKVPRVSLPHLFLGLTESWESLHLFLCFFGGKVIHRASCSVVSVQVQGAQRRMGRLFPILTSTICPPGRMRYGEARKKTRETKGSRTWFFTHKSHQ